jgi:hypothetical protein
MQSLPATLGQLLFTLALYLLGVIVIGLSVFPAAAFGYSVWIGTAGGSVPMRLLSLSLAAAAGYFLYGFSLILIVAALRFLLGLRLREGEYPMVSLGSVRWACANALQLVVSITFMDFVLLTPFASVFFRLMGAKVGRHVQINSKNCADLSLLEIGDGAVIGGHATVIGHSFERGKLILKKVKIGRKAVIGLNSVVLPGAEIGEGATVAAGAVVPKNTQVAANGVHYGRPAGGATVLQCGEPGS